MIKIPLTQGKYALLDDCDYHLAESKWCAVDVSGAGRYYAVRAISDNGRQKHVYLHHVVIGSPLGKLVVDHINGDGLDNRRDNLRLVTIRQNAWNTKVRRNGGTSSQFVGVHWNRRLGKWKSVFYQKGKSVFLGYFDTEIEAARAYQAAIKNPFS